METINTNIQSNQLPNLPHVEPLSVDCFYVAIDQQRDGYRLLGVPVSPYFRTRKEAKAFHASCGIEGAYCGCSTFFPRGEEEARQHEVMMFGDEIKLKPTSMI